MTQVSARDLRNHTASVLKRVEAGEQIDITLNHRPVAQLVPLQRPTWVSGSTVDGILRSFSADPGLLSDIAWLRDQTVAPPSE